MNMRIIAITFAAILVVPFDACAELSMSAGLEGFNWKEEIPGEAIKPRESGMREAFFVDWVQEGDKGVLFAWHAKLYSGRVKYDTSTMNAGTPVSTHTNYSGAFSEVQAFYRAEAGANRLDLLAGAGLDSWERAIENSGFNQIEDYAILYLRLGVGLNAPEHMRGFHGGVGLKYPLSTLENAHLDKLGYYSNPMLHPGRAISGYAEIGYRINRMFDVVGYYDSWRFKQSDAVTVSDAAGLWSVIQPKSSMNVLGVKLNVSFGWM